MPVYNAVSVVKESIESVLNQTFKDFELIITDDNSSDETARIIKEIKDDRIKFFPYKENVGYPKNLERSIVKSSNEIVFLMAQDDILAQGTLKRVSKLFEENKNVGAITRPYYWFHNDVKKPVRAKDQFNSKKDSVISIDSDFDSIIKVFQTLDQLSGLAFRREFIDEKVNEDIFTAHIYPFISIFKKHDVVYLKDYVIAVRIASSQTRHFTSIYSKSPMQSWVDMFNSVFHEEKFREMREYCIKNFVAKNFVGLVQIKNYGKTSWLIREMMLLVKYNHFNILDPRFWFFGMGTLVLPRTMLIPLVDYYKENILSKSLIRVQPINVPGSLRDN